MAWLLLVAASAFEVAFALSIKPAAGFSKLWPSIAVIAFGAVSVVLLSKTLDRLPLGTAYVMWTGLGSVGTVALGIVIFGEPATAARIGCLAMIVAGVIGLRLLGTA